MKRINALYLGISAAFLVVLGFLGCFYIHESSAKRNVTNCKELTLNMPRQAIINIMGMPKKKIAYQARINYKDVDVVRYIYSSPFGASSGVDIYFDKSEQNVIKIVCSDDYQIK